MNKSQNNNNKSKLNINLKSLNEKKTLIKSSNSLTPLPQSDFFLTYFLVNNSNFRLFFFKKIQLQINKKKSENLNIKKNYCPIKKKRGKLFIALCFKDPFLKTFINNLMVCGNKAKAEKITILTLMNFKNLIKKKEARKGKSLFYILKKAVFMLQPLMWLQKIKRFKTNSTPNTISRRHNLAQASKNLIKYARLRQERSIAEKLSNELLETLQKKSTAFRKRKELQSLIVKNRANTRWRFPEL